MNMFLVVILAMVDVDDAEVHSGIAGTYFQNNYFFIRLAAGLLGWLSSAEVIFRSL